MYVLFLSFFECLFLIGKSREKIVLLGSQTETTWNAMKTKHTVVDLFKKAVR